MGIDILPPRTLPPKALVLALSPLAAMAQSTAPSGRHGDGHAENHDWYKDLKQPDIGSRCCNGSVDGKQGDCRPAPSFLGDDGLYRAWDGREWLVVPKGKVITGLAEAAKLPERGGFSAQAVARDAARTLRHLADEIEKKPASRLEDLERRLTVLEEKVFAVLFASTPDEEVVAVRAEADRDLAPYRRKMSGAQIDQLQKQYVHKRLLEKFALPRLSLFYM